MLSMVPLLVTRVVCLYRSSDSGALYGILARKGDQIRKIA